MKLLLDSHIAFWALVSPANLSSASRDLLLDTDHSLFVSSASIWELRLKESTGKLKIPEAFESELRKLGFRELPVSWEHAVAASKLPLIHKDPFDRLLIGQAALEGMSLMTRDSDILKYEGEFFRS